MGRKKKEVVNFKEIEQPDICPNCGETMYCVSDDTSVCTNCDGEYHRDIVTGEWDFYPKEELYLVGGGFDAFGFACDSCGSDMYPDCKDSCKLFDN